MPYTDELLGYARDLDRQTADTYQGLGRNDTLLRQQAMQDRTRLREQEMQNAALMARQQAEVQARQREQQTRAQIQMELQTAKLSQAEQIRLSKLENGEALLREQFEAGFLNNDEFDAMRTELMTKLKPMQMRASAAQAKRAEEQQRLLEEQTKKAVGLNAQNQAFEMSTLEDRKKTLTNKKTGETVDYLMVAPGKIEPIPWPSAKSGKSEKPETWDAGKQWAVAQKEAVAEGGVTPKDEYGSDNPAYMTEARRRYAEKKAEFDARSGKPQPQPYGPLMGGEKWPSSAGAPQLPAVVGGAAAFAQPNTPPQAPQAPVQPQPQPAPVAPAPPAAPKPPEAEPQRPFQVGKPVTERQKSLTRDVSILRTKLASLPEARRRPLAEAVDRVESLLAAYGSVEAMPQEVRAQYEAAARSLLDLPSEGGESTGRFDPPEDTPASASPLYRMGAPLGR